MNGKMLALVALTAAPLLALAGAAQAPGQALKNARAYLDQNCVSCHAARGTPNIKFSEMDLAQPVQNAELWEKVLLKLRTGIEPKVSPNQTRPAPGDTRAFIIWLESELDRSAPPYWPALGMRRLNRTEYGNAIQSLLAIEINVTKLLPVEDSVFGFDNMTDALARQTPAQAYVAAAASISHLALEAGNPDSPSRRAIFVCRPNGANDEECARRIVTTLTRRAFRRPAAREDVNALMAIYQTGRRDADFERGLETALRAILMDPKFLFRIEAEPGNLGHAQSYRISDVELASRLSFFIWSGPPDDELIRIAAAGQLHDPAVLERETRRLLQDPRSQALAVNFAGQWLNLRSLDFAAPSPDFYPAFDEPLRQAMRRESELFFDSMVREDRNVVELLNADYTFVNERLAKHYGIPGVTGAEFRRVVLSPAFEHRRGLLGKAAILTVTSRPDRTSPVFRGKWMLETLLGIHPPDPPPNVPALAPRWIDAKPPSMRKIMLDHRVNASCMMCHSQIDPIGLALENFDGIGSWRTTHAGEPLDLSGELIDGTTINSLADLRLAFVGREDQFVQTLTLKLFTYALGRGPNHRDMPVIRSLAGAAAREKNRFSRLVLGIVMNPVFQMNTKP